MNLALFEFLLEGAKTLQADSKRDNWQGIARGEFLWTVTQVTNREDLNEAIIYLQKVISREVLYPTIPPNLEQLVKELDSYRQEANQQGSEKVTADLRRLRTHIVQLQLEEAGVTTQPQIVYTAPPAPEPAEPEPFVRRTVMPRPPTPPAKAQRPTAGKPGVTIPPSFSSTAPAAPATIYLSRAPLRLSIPQTIIHTFASFPLQSFRLLTSLGQEALGRQAAVSPAATSLVWQTGITSKSLRQAVDAYQKSPTSEREVVKALLHQADILEAFEINQPTQAQQAVFVNNSQNTRFEITSEKPPTGLQLTVDTATGDLAKIEPVVKPQSLAAFLSSIQQSSVVKAASSPLKTAAANLASRLQIAVLKAPLEIHRAIFPGQVPPPPTGPATGTTAPSATLPYLPGYTTPTQRAAGSFPPPVVTSAGSRPFVFIGRMATQGLGAIGTGVLRGGLGAVMEAGRAIGGIGSLLGGGGAAGGAATATPATVTNGFWLVIAFATAGIVLILGFLNITGHQGAYLTVAGLVPTESEFIDVKKTTPKTSYDNNNLPDTLAYTIVVSPKKKKLKQVTVSDNTRVGGKNTNKEIFNQKWDVDEIDKSWQQQFSIPLSVDLKNEMVDSLIINTVTVRANVEDFSLQETASTTLTIRVGNPPEDCPLDWPTAHGKIDQGPNGPVTHQGAEAIDINQPLGTPVYATHQGIANIGKGSGVERPTDVPDRFVKITGSCNGSTFKTSYHHLKTQAVSNGQQIKRGDLIGTIDQTGYADYNHLHYQFSGIKMEPPYIPQMVPRGCGGSGGNCNVSW